MTVCVVGDINVDLELLLPTSTAGEHANPEPTLSGGGSAANTAAALARLGVPTRFCGVVGGDAFGAAAVDSLSDCGVDVSRVRSAAGGMTVAVIVVVPGDGERIIYVWPPRGGAHLELAETDVLAALDGAAWLHISGIALRGRPASDSIISAMEAARATGVKVSLDVNLRLENWGWESGFRDTIERALGLADVVFGGIEEELAPLAGADSMDAVEVLAGRGPMIVGRSGLRGAIATIGSETVESRGWVVPVVDTVGAGDAFDAGFISARIGGDDLAASLEFANAVAALTVGRSGARSTPTRGEVQSLMNDPATQRT